jgi:polyhydroxyalkanoate synthesis repressor PhaR
MKRIIKRYKNRKLYDVRTGSFVTLLDLVTMIKNGDKILVLEHDTQQDITDKILIQVIIELVKTRKPMFSLSELLHNLIKSDWQLLHKILRVVLFPVPAAKSFSLKELQKRLPEPKLPSLVSSFKQLRFQVVKKSLRRKKEGTNEAQ